MPRNFIIAIGGTGSRCAEAVIHLAAAGLFEQPIHLLVIDPDQNNGNTVAVRTLLDHYVALHRASQPKEASIVKFGLFKSELPGPTFFQPAINLDPNTGAFLPATWSVPYLADRRFRDVIQFAAQDADIQEFLRLFYTDAEMEMALGGGYRGKPNVGSVALKQDLTDTSTADRALHEFLRSLNTEVQNGEARVFVIGSVFGGTGAAGVPTIPALIRSLPDDVVTNDGRDRIRFGAALLSPYFSFPQKGHQDSNEISTDSSLHPGRTQAALMYYSRIDTGYHHMYLVGSPARHRTNDHHVVLGDGQKNRSHYAELTAALAAADFFSKRTIPPETHKLHFTNSLRDSSDLGVTWETLPFRDARGRAEARTKLTAFTTLAYFYRNFLHHGFVTSRSYEDADWYRYNFTKITLRPDAEEETLETLNRFCVSYLEWLRLVGLTCPVVQNQPQLFNFDALDMTEPSLCEERLPNLLGGSTSVKRGVENSYSNILERMTRLQLRNVQTDSATGLFIYLLDKAVSGYSKQNYSLER
jgi:hypothetical protein